MTRLTLFALCAATGLSLFGQGQNPHRYTSISAGVRAINFEIPNSDEFEDLSFTYALDLAVRRQLTKHVGVAVPFKVGVVDVGQLENPSWLALEAMLQLFPVGTLGKITPFVQGGYGSAWTDGEFSDNQFPVGAGSNFLLGENSWLSVQAEYRMSSQALRDNVQFGLGYIYRLRPVDSDGDGVNDKIDLCPDVAGTAATQGCPDTDMDGIVDNDDLCPTVAGLASLNGCPDGDGDGITDASDSCPDEAGPATTGGCPDADGDGVADRDDPCPQSPGPVENRGCPDSDGDGIPDDMDACPLQAASTPNGCPPADSDGDGIPDVDDACPDVAGAPSLNGCPDTDGDGITDAADRCPNEVGPASNAGCPEITEEVRETLEYAAQAVEFETGSDKLKESSYVILAEIAGILRQYPDYDLLIAGHTDSVGSDATNLDLSQRRARACADFLIATGIRGTRISSIGYGETRPKASNATREGRQLNRRVEFDLKLSE